MTTCHRDQVTYRAETVERFLPAIWDEEWVHSARPGRVDSGGLKTKPDPRHIPDYLLAAADVQVGFRRGRLTHSEKECLRHTVHLGFTPGELSTIWGVPSEQIHGECLRGIARITNYLNGRTPA